MMLSCDRATQLCFRVLSESGCFLLILFAATHRAPQFFQCRGPGPGPGLQLDCEFLSASQSVTLYQVTTHPTLRGLQQLHLIDELILSGADDELCVQQVASVDGQSLQCELSSDDHRQTETFRAAQSSFNRYQV